MSELFGIGGALRSGKDTVADYLVEKHGWIKLGMSEPLNNALLTMNPLVPVRKWGLFTEYIPYAELHSRVGYTKAKTNYEVRRLLQVLGTEVGRKMINENVWVDIAARRIRVHAALGQNVIMTGIRFPNEIKMIQDLEGANLYVTRPDLEVSAGSGHDSETSVTKALFDIEIENDGSLDDLYSQVDDLLDLLGIT